MKHLSVGLAFGLFLATASPGLAQDGNGNGNGTNGNMAGMFEAPAANWLIVQNGASMTFDGKTVTLENVTPQTIMFTDRPQRMAGNIATRRFIDDWGAGQNNFQDDPPNASLSILVGNEEQISVVELTNPQLSGTSLSYDVTVLEGEVPASGQATTLFIDYWYGPRGGVCRYGPFGGVRCGWRPMGPWGPPW